MLLSRLRRRFVEKGGRRGAYVSHGAPRSIVRIGLPVGMCAGGHPHHRGAALATHVTKPLNGPASGAERAFRSMFKRYTIRSLWVMWAASLAYLVVPVSIAEPAPSGDGAMAGAFSGATWSECHAEWKLRFCAPTETTPEDQDPEHHRVKARDVLRAMADALLGEGFQLLNIGRHSGPSFLERALDTGPVQYFVLSDSNGMRVRMRTKDDGWSISLRNSPSEYDNESLAVKVGIDVRW